MPLAERAASISALDVDNVMRTEVADPADTGFNDGRLPDVKGVWVDSDAKAGLGTDCAVGRAPNGVALEEANLVKDDDDRKAQRADLAKNIFISFCICICVYICVCVWLQFVNKVGSDGLLLLFLLLYMYVAFLPS